MVSWALKKYLRGYSLKDFKSDLIAGLIVSLIALPLAMALAIAVGLSPQYGLYTAIVAGFVIPLLGGSCHQVSGPTAAFVVIIAPLINAHGVRGLIITTLIAGFILIVAGLVKLGRYINYIPYPVTTGFTSGIAVVIAVLALNDFLGLSIQKLPESFLGKTMCIVANLPYAHWPEMAIGLVSLLLMLTARLWVTALPAPIIGIGGGILLSLLCNRYGYGVATIGSRFSYSLPDGSLGHGIPPHLPSFEILGLSSVDLFKLPSFEELRMLIVPALVIASLAALESLLSAVVADGMANTKHNPDAELIGMGIGNVLTSFASGIPATGAIARTATNIKSGGKTPIASSLHALFILFYMVFFSSYMSYIPMAALAALLLVTAYQMSHLKQFIRVLKIGPLEDAVVLLVCFVCTVLIDMVAGVTAGVVMACFLLVKRIANITQMQVSRSKNQHVKMNNNDLPSNTIVYHIAGPLFFGNVEQVLGQIETVSSQVETFVIDLEEVSLLDMTGLVALKRITLDLSKNKKNIVLCTRKSLARRIDAKFSGIPRDTLFIKENLKEALERARTLHS